jgi:N,N-dimethylformamidase
VTTGMLNSIGDFTADGGRFMYIGGNGYFWSVGQHSELPGVMESRNFLISRIAILATVSEAGL